MQAATREAAASIQAIGATIVDVSEIAAAIAAAVEEQGAATQEISRNVQEAAKGTVEVASSITEVNQGAAETGSASSQVLAASQELSQQGSRLKSQVDTFPRDGARGLSVKASLSHAATASAHADAVCIMTACHPSGCLVTDDTTNFSTFPASFPARPVPLRSWSCSPGSRRFCAPLTG